jgi:hypothetical protein
MHPRIHLCPGHTQLYTVTLTSEAGTQQSPGHQGRAPRDSLSVAGWGVDGKQERGGKGRGLMGMDANFLASCPLGPETALLLGAQEQVSGHSPAVWVTATFRVNRHQRRL